jgi:hypothetical protein
MRTRGSSGGAGSSRWRTGLLVPLVVGVASLSLPGFSGSTSEPERQPDIAALFGESLERRQADPGSQRPLYLPEPDGHLSTASPPTPMSNTSLVSKTAQWGRLNLPYLIADSALPFRYHVDRGLAERFGLEEVVDAMSQWDDVPGSRWATELASVVNHPGDGPRRDGHPVVYLRYDCPTGYLGTARWNTDPQRMHLDQRYGAGALYGTQVDIAVCAQIETPDQLRGLLAHEVGHVMGMAHLCEPGEVCWEPESEEAATQRCRPMYAMWGPCRAGLTERDHEAARHLYPTLSRLHGPSRVETAARASYVTTWTHTAATVVLARADQGVPEALLGAALSGALGGSLLLAVPDPVDCLRGPAASELARAAPDHGTVLLVGEWPQHCDGTLASWNLAVRRLQPPSVYPTGPGDSHASRLSVAAAQLLVETADPPVGALLVPFDEGEIATAALDGAIAAAEAGRRRQPLLLTSPRALGEDVERWLDTQPGLRELWIVGEPEPSLLADLARRGLTTVRIPGADPVARAATLASSRAPASRGTARSVVIAPSEALADAVVAAAVAGRLGVPLLLSPPQPHPGVLAWLERYAPQGGYVVGSLSGIPYPTQRAYATAVAPAENPVPSRRDAPRGLFELPHIAP